jgi:hypothetical protein
MNDSVESNVFTTYQLFVAPMYKLQKLEFLPIVKKIAKKYILKRKKQVELNSNYPVYMTENLNFEPEMLNFSNYVAQTAWNLLNEQGYNMQFFQTYFIEMWCQEHHKGSSMERHIHGNGAIISGFYFLDCPADSKILFHDLREAKVITNLPEKDQSQWTAASNIVNFPIQAGDLVFTNSWLPHSFDKITGKESLRFVHFNIGVTPALEGYISDIQKQNTPKAEII